MNITLRIAAAIVATAAVVPAFALDITLPPETIQWRASDLPGFALVQRNCMTCHSADYAQYQPSSSRAYWDATVKKMKKPFGAAIADEDIPAMVDYLVKTYGTERGTATIRTVAATAPAAPTSVQTITPDTEKLLAVNNCLACHAVDKKVVGPAYKEVAAKYKGNADAVAQVMRSIKNGGSGKWGSVPMTPYPQLTDAELKTLANWVLSR